jgi:ligand-binding sensor domain-containing protein/two-component sensor histidine kinase
VGEHLPGNYIRSLLVSRDGRLWIGTKEGLASWKDGKLTHYADLAGHAVPSLLEDREGTVWAAGFAIPIGRLCAIQSGSTQCYGEGGSFGRGMLSLFEDSGGNFWALGATGLWRWKPGPPKLYSMPEPRALIEGDNGALLIAMSGGISQFVEGKAEAYPLPGAARQFTPNKLLRDRNGGLWIGTGDRGLLHVHRGRTDLFTQSDGLSSDVIESLFEDREGNIWVSTSNGLDHFHDFAVPTISVKQGLSSAAVWSVLAARDGSVWFGTIDGLNRWKDGQITIYRKRRAQAMNGGATRDQRGTLGALREINDSGLSDDYLESLFQDGGGRIWVSTRRGVAYFENGRFISVSAVPAGLVNSIGGDGTGNLWISHQNYGLFRLPGGNMVERIPWARLGRNDWAATILSDPLRGGLWLGFFQGGVAFFKDGQVRESYAGSDGLGEGRVNGFQLDRDGTLWAATQGGLSRVKDGRVATLTSRSGLPCDAAQWVVEDDAHSFWLYTACGLVRIARPDLEAWAAVADKGPKRAIQVTLFDSSDGVRSHSDAGGFSPHVAKSADGRLWFSTFDGVSVIDPRHLPFNKLPPPVHIEQIRADRKTYETSSNVRLPPLVRDLEIDYTALSLVAPEKIHFRYKLDGWDPDWQEVGNRRQAFYTNLSPRNYRFRVAACNNSGVWNEAGVSVDFSIAPAYYQTTWFLVLCACAVMSIVYSIHRYRVARLLQLERVRTRIATDLHDDIGASLSQIAVVSEVLSQRGVATDQFRELLSQIATDSRELVASMSDIVWAIDPRLDHLHDLVPRMRRFASDMFMARGIRFQFVASAADLRLSSEQRRHIFLVFKEAVNNIVRHSDCTEAEISLETQANMLVLRVGDNGRGFDCSRTNSGKGLSSIRARAEALGGGVEVAQGEDCGSRITLTLPLGRLHKYRN